LALVAHLSTPEELDEGEAQWQGKFEAFSFFVATNEWHRRWLGRPAKTLLLATVTKSAPH
jgi:hypothetical protein